MAFSLFSCFSLFSQPSRQGRNDDFLEKLLSAYSARMDSILSRRGELNIQVIYTQIDRRKNGRPVFTDYFFHIDPSVYTYPASTVKLPVAALALQKLNELNIPGLNANTTMITEAPESWQSPAMNCPVAPDGRPTVAHYIKKILLVSDNDAFNRLYEFLGPDYINQNLKRMGYPGAEIIHRLSINLSPEQNRMTNPVRFYDSTGRILYEKPAAFSSDIPAPRHHKLGKGYMRNGVLVHEPFDFSQKNRLALPDLHGILKAILFPRSVEASKRFDLKPEDYELLKKYMGMRPSESEFPSYRDVGDNYVKNVFAGTGAAPVPHGMRIYNKSGTAYGFLLDAAYVVDYKARVEFLVSAQIYCNSDGILNDDHYDYQDTGYPFMKELGEALYQYELTRPRKRIPVLSSPFPD